MKKILLSLFLVGIILIPSIARAEEVANFSANLTIEENGKVLVVEKIIYDFGSLQKHGIYRDIPYKYELENGKSRVSEVKVKSVKDENGVNYNYETTKNDQILRVKIGDINKTISGQKTYILTYEVANAVNFFDDHDELYWNIVGNAWVVPIESAVANVSFAFEKNVLQNEIQAECYFGEYGSNQKCNSKILENGANFFTGILSPGQGMTIVIGFSKGLVKGPSAGEILWNKIRQFLPLIFPIIIFISLFGYWKKNGKDPKGRGTIIPEYEAPKNMLPAEGGIVIDEKMDTRDITATVIDLARRGYFKLTEVEKKVLGFGAGKDWKIIKTKEAEASLNDFEKELYNIFLSGRQEVLVSDLKQETISRARVKKMKDYAYESIVIKGWFSKNPDKARMKFIGIGSAIIFGLFFLGGFLGIFQFGAVMIVSLIISGALFFIFGKHMPQKTTEGTLAKEYLEGFKMFLSVTEKDRVEFHFSPSAHPEKFAEYLPWAIIFGVEKQWAEVFKGIDLPAPDWYEGNWGGIYSAMILSDALHSFDSDFGKTMSAVGASAAAGGASGFGGGGFSGGGFGGGGGGSW
jgi:uncharacterized membrane protein